MTVVLSCLECGAPLGADLWCWGCQVTWGKVPQIQTVDAAVLLHRYDRLKAEAVNQAAPLAPLDDEVTKAEACIIGAERALSWLREALRLPPGSGGTGAQTARERAYTGQPRARWGPESDRGAW